MRIEVRNGDIYVFGAFGRDGFTMSAKYVRSVIHKKLKEREIYGVELWDMNHPDPGAFQFEVLDRYSQFNLEDGEL